MTAQPATPPPRGIRIPQPIAAEEDMPHPTAARLALEVLWQQFTHAIPGTLEPEAEAVNRVMRSMHDMLWRREREAADETGLYAHYIIIRPLNPLNMPAPGEVAEITAALATLNRHDLLARPWTDETTE